MNQRTKRIHYFFLIMHVGSFRIHTLTVKRKMNIPAQHLYLLLFSLSLFVSFWDVILSEYTIVTNSSHSVHKSLILSGSGYVGQRVTLGCTLCVYSPPDLSLMLTPCVQTCLDVIILVHHIL